MNKLKLMLLTLVVTFAVPCVASSDTDSRLTKDNIHKKTDAEIKARVEALENRLQEIQSIDFSTLERSEKRALKDEVKDIKKEMALDSRISISVGAAIIIVLLLIILL